MDVRGVVTCHDADGKAIFVSDDQVAPVVPALLAVFICGAHHDRVG